MYTDKIFIDANYIYVTCDCMFSLVMNCTKTCTDTT